MFSLLFSVLSVFSIYISAGIQAAHCEERGTEVAPQRNQRPQHLPSCSTGVERFPRRHEPVKITGKTRPNTQGRQWSYIVQSQIVGAKDWNTKVRFIWTPGTAKRKSAKIASNSDRSPWGCVESVASSPVAAQHGSKVWVFTSKKHIESMHFSFCICEYPELFLSHQFACIR